MQVIIDAKVNQSKKKNKKTGKTILVKSFPREAKRWDKVSDTTRRCCRELSTDGSPPQVLARAIEVLREFGLHE